MSMIIIVSHPGDGHAQWVSNRLAQRRADSAMLDISSLTQDGGISIAYDSPGYACELALGPKTVRLDQQTAIWWRRPQPVVPSAALSIAAHREFAASEFYEALTGMWQSADVAWVNHPRRDEEAARKVYQLKLAQRANLEIPKTRITNRPNEARAFLNECGPNRTICKSFSATEREWRETRLVRDAEIEALANVRFAPVIFQEYVPAEVDLRVTVVGDDVFPAAIHSQETSYQVDCRMEIGKARIEPTTIPDDIRSKIIALMRDLQIVYGAIDMRLTPDGRYVFLEVNPSGQWLFIEERTKQPITESLVNYLVSACGGD